MRKPVVIVITLAFAAIATACYQPYDLIGDFQADRIYIDADGVWRDADGTSPPLFTNPEGADWMVPGNYDRGPKWEAAATDGVNWYTAGDAGTIRPTSAGDRVWPVPADYDGDGLDEPAWYRDSDATWWIDGAPAVQFGIGGTDQEHAAHDVPVPGDYDGDGRAEIVVYRPTDGTFRTHGGGIVDEGWPIGIPAPANFYAFGRGLEAAVYDPNTRTWWDEGPVTSGFSLGESTAGIPVPGRYRGRAEDEPAVVVPNGATMEWRYIGECCEITVQTTPIGTPLMARAAVLGAIPRLTYLASLG